MIKLALSLQVNPYTPGAGMVPQYLAGRQDLIKDAENILAYIASGLTNRSVVYYGLRGVGKTVLLAEIEKIAADNNIYAEHIEAMENGSFMQSVSLYVYKLLRRMSSKEKARQYLDRALSVVASFQLFYNKEGETSIGINPEMIKDAGGIADTGNMQNDLTELFIHLGRVGKEIGVGAVLFIDEVQYIKEAEFEALMAAIHRCNQLGLPVVIFAAGLPKVAKIAGDIKSYAERLFRFVPVDRLSEEDARLAIITPAERFGVKYDDEALSIILKHTECYPYFLQEYGMQIWKYLDSNTKEFTQKNAEEAYKDFVDALDEGFFKVRHDRANSNELAFMKAMVQCGNLPCSINKVAALMHSNYRKISPIRAQLIHKGFIYATSRGEVSFTVPQFDQYLKRLYGL